jgi:ribosomal protein L40E
MAEDQGKEEEKFDFTGEGKAMICQQCQSELPEDAKFCSQCGIPVPQPQVAVVCQKCQSELPEGARFCTECGTSAPEPQTLSVSFEGVANRSTIQQSGATTSEPQATPFSFDGVVNRSTVQQIGSINIGGMTEGQFGEITHQLSQVLDRLGVSASARSDDHSAPASQEAQEVAQAVTEKVREAEERFQHPVGDAEVYLQLGYVAWGNQEYQEAIERYNEAIHIDPNYASAYANWGWAYGNLGENQRAIENYDNAIQLDPNDASAYGNRGLAYGNLGQHQRAIENYDKVIQLDPDNAIACRRSAIMGHI